MGFSLFWICLESSYKNQSRKWDILIVSVWWCTLSLGLWLSFYYMQNRGRISCSCSQWWLFLFRTDVSYSEPRGEKWQHWVTSVVMHTKKPLRLWNTAKPCDAFYQSKKNDLISLCNFTFLYSYQMSEQNLRTKLIPFLHA